VIVQPPPFRPARSVLRVSNELVKAVLIDTSTGVGHPVMYNPEEYKLEQGNTFAEVGVPGLGTPPLQYVRGKARTLSMELFFDTYETGEDVRTRSGPVIGLLDQDPQTHAPPILLFAMGRFQFQCVMVDAGQRYTMFLPDGTPVRSTVSVKFQEYVRVEAELRSGLFFGSPTVSAAVNATAGAVRSVLSGKATVHLTIEGDTLSGLAGAYLGDPGLWRLIAQANGITDPFDLRVNRSLVIPARPSNVAGTTGGGRR
jgi:Contractile injection system tube protein/LysM domain